MKTFDAIVVGAGAMGSSAALHLARRGAKVLALDRFDVPHVMGSSGGHTRMIRLAYYEHPDYVPLLRRAYDLWHEIERDAGEKLIHLPGGIYMGPPAGEVIAGTLQAAQLHGLEHETLDRDQLRRRFPMFDLPDIYVGVWEPAAGFVLCEKAIGAMSRLAMMAGAEFHGREIVESYRREGGGFTVTTHRGAYTAGRLIFTGGAWTPEMFPRLAHLLVVTRQVLGWVWPSDAARFEHGRFGVWGIEQPDGSLAYGFPMLSDLPGLKLARHGRGQVSQADTLRREIDDADIAEIDGLVKRWLPSATGPVISAKVCMYTNSPDGHFIVDELEQGVVVACGFSGHGFKFASVMGEVLAEMAMDGKTRHPVAFLGMSRFT